MSEAAENPRAVPGSNRAPLKDVLADQLTQLPELLAAETAELEKRVTDLLDGEGRMPKHIADGDDELAAKVVAFQGQVQKAIKAAEAMRVDLTEPSLTAQRVVMSHFRAAVFSKLGENASNKQGERGGLFDRIGNLLTDYERRKAAIERKKREDEERRAREAAAAAERARQEADRLAREAADAERRRQAEAAAAIRDEQDLQAAIEQEHADKMAQERRAEAARVAQAEAERLAAEAAKAADSADAKQSQLSRTSGLYGSSSSLRESWKARVDHDKVKSDPAAMAALWDHIKPEAIEDAANRLAKIKKNTVKITGVEFFDASRAQVRA